jgi:prevent-host-death family protein
MPPAAARTRPAPAAPRPPRPVATLRNERGARVEPASFTSTEAKNGFGRVLEAVTQGGVVVITKHDRPQAVILPVEEFNALADARRAPLDTLTAEFDALLERLQTPKARAGLKAAFEASPKALARAARAPARRRG